MRRIDFQRADAIRVRPTPDCLVCQQSLIYVGGTLARADRAVGMDDERAGFRHHWDAGYVYFVLLEDHHRGWTKIGWAGDPWDRLKTLQTGCPFPLKLIGVVPGSPDDERWLHAALEAHRGRGEWFWLEPGWEAIEELCLVDGPLRGKWERWIAACIGPEERTPLLNELVDAIKAAMLVLT